jgi:hypothetical protein
MVELSARRKRVVVLGGVMSPLCLVGLVVARHHLWITFLCIAVEVVMLVYMMRELSVLKNEG